MLKTSDLIKRLQLHLETFGDQALSFATVPLNVNDEWREWRYCLIENHNDDKCLVVLNANQ